MVDVTGRCQCGGVSFEAKGLVRVTYCHCSICRRVTGAPFIAVAGTKPEQMSIALEDGVRLDTYDTSPVLTRHRCSRCGAAIYNHVHLDNGFTWANFMVPLMDDADALPRSHHIYYADRVVDVDDGLQKFDAFGRPD